MKETPEARAERQEQAKSRRAQFLKTAKCAECGKKQPQVNLIASAKDPKHSPNVWQLKTDEAFNACLQTYFDILCRKCAMERQFIRGTRSKVEHGKISMYRQYKCRCAACREAKSIDTARRKLKRGFKVKQAVQWQRVLEGADLVISRNSDGLWGLRKDSSGHARNSAAIRLTDEEWQALGKAIAEGRFDSLKE